MEYFNYDIDNYKVHIIKTDKFKTVALNVSIRFDDRREDIKYFGLLKRMLVNTSKYYESIRDLNIACSRIYDPVYSVNVLSSGSQDILELEASFSNEKYTECGMNEKALKFLLDVLFEPRIIDDGFDNEIFKIQKEKVLEDLRNIKNNPRRYAEIRLLECMKVREYDVIKIDELISEISSLTSKELYSFYKYIMENGVLDITLCGDLDENIVDVFKKYVKFDGKYIHKNHVINQRSYNKEANVVIEDSNNTQSNLIVGCKLLDLTDFERNYVLVLYSWILGGGMGSLLNQTVREKNSLCYYIYAVRQYLLSTVKIYAGINASDYDKTYELIKKEMKNMEDGNFSLDLLNSVKEIYYNSLIRMEDSNADIVYGFNMMLFTGMDKLEERKEKMKSVTKEDVIKLAKKVHIDTVYLLKGVSGNGEA